LVKDLLTRLVAASLFPRHRATARFPLPGFNPFRGLLW
jgi:hypothetical protein